MNEEKGEEQFNPEAKRLELMDQHLKLNSEWERIQKEIEILLENASNLDKLGLERFERIHLRLRKIIDELREIEGEIMELKRQ